MQGKRYFLALRLADQRLYLPRKMLRKRHILLLLDVTNWLVPVSSDKAVVCGRS